ncbi:hypothetical protein [Robertmurraya kyonggiensis]|uniref:Uncharacterized protein n=1 Tax=Robertmurraya kyonggiensis TaxID=1037680 RepID=A0A4V5P1J3_9BACI|nr:hypothetical protein [Robertmurraya kyonggiensis]TKC18480.1 hypothetical protein FA727_02710 [Robertmurraya kyonggiensis]
MRKYIILPFTVIIIIIFLIIFTIYGRAIFQEGNPLPIVKAIIQLETSDSDYIQFSKTPPKYISKSNIDRETMLKKYMEKDNWTYIEQLGGGYIFTKDNEQAIVVTKQFSSKYFVWEVPSEN